MVVVEVNSHSNPIRVITGYGPQESWAEMERMPFGIALEEEVAAAEINGRAVIIQFDANAKLGKQHIKRDPKEISENGKVLAGILDRHALVVVNGLEDK